MGQPWIFAKLLGHSLPSVEARLDLIREHLDAMHGFYGTEAGVRIARKHIQAYLQRWGVPELIGDFMTLADAKQQHAWLLARRQQMLQRSEYVVTQRKEVA